MLPFNPYEAPRAFEPSTWANLPLLPTSRWHEVQVHVVSVNRGWWKRRLALGGSIDAEIEYDPRGQGERVYINRGLAVTTSMWGTQLVQPHIDFVLEVFQHVVPASIDVEASFWQLLRTTSFRLTIAGKTVYED